MTFNVFAPVIADVAWLTRSLTSLGYGHPVGDFNFEYRPGLRRASWFDKTVIDAFVPTSRGGLVVETKLADQFSRRGTALNASEFYEVMNDEVSLWKQGTHFEVGAVDQLARVHGAGSVAIGRAADLLLVHHALDVATPKKVEGYRKIMKDPSRLRVLTLDALLDVFLDAASDLSQRDAIRRLQVRYTDMSLSSAVFQKIEASRLRF